MNTTSEMIEVIQAHKDGRNVQWKFHTPVLGAGQDWTDLVVAEHPFNFSITDYRVKPEPPKPREFQLAMCRKHGSGGWKAYEWPERPRIECEHCEVITVKEVLQ